MCRIVSPLLLCFSHLSLICPLLPHLSSSLPLPTSHPPSPSLSSLPSPLPLSTSHPPSTSPILPLPTFNLPPHLSHLSSYPPHPFPLHSLPPPSSPSLPPPQSTTPDSRSSPPVGSALPQVEVMCDAPQRLVSMPADTMDRTDEEKSKVSLSCVSSRQPLSVLC